MYQIEVQFYTPENIPTAVGVFNVEGKEWQEAVSNLQEYLDDCGYPRNQVSIIKIQEVL